MSKAAAALAATRRRPSLNRRSGLSDRLWETRAGSFELKVPKLRQGGGFPERLEPRRTAEKAHTAVIQEAYVQGISSRSVDDCCWMRPSYSMRCLQRCRALGDKVDALTWFAG